LEARATNGSGSNQVYGIFMITTQDMRSDYSVSIADIPQSRVSQPSWVIKELVKQRIDVMRAEMKAKYEEQKRQQREKMIAYKSNHYPSFYGPLWDFYPPPPPSATSS
jgi:hypothetical protein